LPIRSARLTYFEQTIYSNQFAKPSAFLPLYLLTISKLYWLHMSLLDPQLEQALQKDLQIFSETEIPIVTVSASFKEDLKGFYGFPEDEFTPDVVFSRAHFSMALGIAVKAWGNARDIRPNKAWIVDPTNYVSHKQWKSVQFTEFVGKTLARKPLLKALKDLLDRFARNKLPILESITPPLLYVTQNTDKAILSLHIAAGNILAKQGKKVVQVVTDPHVREDYLENAQLKNICFCVFDEKTRTDFLEKAVLMDKKVDPSKIVVTGPPIDPRIIAARDKKNPWRSGKLRLCISTGGLGTNKPEIRKALRQLMPELRKHKNRFQVLVYAGTQKDICSMVREIAKENKVSIGDFKDPQAKLRLLYHPQIMDANELLLKYGFPWAHGFLSKPSGDMAYDVAASGSFLLTLKEWGVWEYNIREVFEQKGVARAAVVDDLIAQLEALMSASGKSQSWIENAMNNAHNLGPLYREGAKNIIDIVEKKSCEK
jgi:hypothetical protein